MQLRPLITSLIALAGSCAVHAQPEPTIADAHRAHYLGQPLQALALYERLAATGNHEAAEFAGFLLLRRAGTCSTRSVGDADRAAALLLQAARAGRPVAGGLLNLLDNTD